MAESVATVNQAAEYLADYARRYRHEAERLTTPAPEGAGFPAVIESPYLGTGVLSCIVANDGAAVIDQSSEPSDEWHIAGGPALMVDYQESRVPTEIVDLLKTRGLYGKPIGIYRICFPSPVSEDVWRGLVPPSIDQATVQVPDGPMIDVSRVDMDLFSLIARLTFGAYGPILDIHLPKDTTANVWQPTIIRGLGFVTADRKSRRFFHYLELLRHSDPAAWDKRSVWARQS